MASRTTRMERVRYAFSESTRIRNRFTPKDHLSASILAGLVDKFNGASNIFNDRAVDGQVTVTLCCTIRTKMEQLVSIDDIRKLLPSARGRVRDQIPAGATHAVVGLVYGAHANCIFAQDNGDGSDYGSKETMQNLTTTASIMYQSLEKKKDKSSFKEQLAKEKRDKLVDRIRCRLYSDLDPNASPACDIFKAYKRLLKIVSLVSDNSSGSHKAVTITALLTPLRAIVEPSERQYFQYRDVDDTIVARCHFIWTELERIKAKAEAIKNAPKNNQKSLHQFCTSIGSYKKILKRSLRNAIVEGRRMSLNQTDERSNDRELMKIAKIAENHPLFKPSRLEKWLSLKKSEFHVLSKMSNLKGIDFVVNKRKLDKELSEGFHKNYSLVLTVPPVDERSSTILQKMKHYTENYLKIVESVEEDEDEIGNDEEYGPWHVCKRQRKFIFEKIQRFADYVQKNQKAKGDSVQYIITLGNNGDKSVFNYSVYKAEKLMIANLLALFEPPTDVAVQMLRSRKQVSGQMMSVIKVYWNYEDSGLPCHFIVEYRHGKESSQPWTQKKTSQAGEKHLVLWYNHNETMEIRVCADTCIGRSDFSEAIRVDSTLLCTDLEEFETMEDEESSSTAESLSKKPRLDLLSQNIVNGAHLKRKIKTENGIIDLTLSP